MIDYNKSFNKLEKVITDPNVSDDGYVWFNIYDKNFKIKADGKIRKVVLVDDDESSDLRSYLNDLLNEYELVVEVENSKNVEINHGLNIDEFLYSVYDSDEKQYLISSADVVDKDTIKFEFVDYLNGKIYIKFNIHSNNK
jgi:hypothetical protein